MNTLLKKTAIATVLAASVLSLSACDHEVSVSKNGAVVNANATATVALNDKSSFEEKAAYAIGASLGEYVAQMKQSQEQLIGPISAEKVIEGFTDGVNGASALDRAQIEKVLKDLDAKIQEKISQEQKKSAEDNLKVDKRVSRFVLPICTTINMNGCAAFIFITSIYLLQNAGIDIGFGTIVAWIFIATFAAVGNAGVPMGCYFLTLSLVSSMNVPVALMGIILPVYAVIDMIETALNVWSDSCVANIVNKEVKDKLPEIQE